MFVSFGLKTRNGRKYGLMVINFPTAVNLRSVQFSFEKRQRGREQIKTRIDELSINIET